VLVILKDKRDADDGYGNDEDAGTEEDGELDFAWREFSF